MLDISTSSSYAKMLALLRCNRRLQLIGEFNFSSCLITYHFKNYFSSTSSVAAVSSIAQNDSSNLMAEYLINTIGLSRDEAISASTKVSHLKSTLNPDLVLNLLKNYGGLDQSHLKELVSSVPQVLLHKPDENLESKLRVFKDLGLTGSDLVKLVKGDHFVFWRGLENVIVPIISYLRKLMGGCNDKVVKAINRSSWLLSSATLKAMPANIVLLQQDYGFSSEQIQKLLLYHPRILLRAPDRFQDVLSRVQSDLGIRRGSSAFFFGLIASASLSRPTIEKKFGVFRSFGWSDSDIFALVNKMPLVLSISESKLQQMLNFYVKELGYPPVYFLTRSCLLTYSLDKRVKPRAEVLKILKELKLVKSSIPFYSVVLLTEMKFVEKFMLPFKDEVPNLYTTYTANVKQLPKDTVTGYFSRSPSFDVY